MCVSLAFTSAHMLPEAYSLSQILRICLLSDAGKKHQHVLSFYLFRPNDFSSEGFNDWAFMTTHSWDEDPQGEWTLEIENVAPNGRDYGNLTHLH